MKNYHYCGDVSLEHGGFYYTSRDSDFRFSDVVRITPCSDAGGPDNVFWIDRLTVNLPDAAEREKIEERLKTGGFTGAELTPEQEFATLVEMAVMAGDFEQDYSEMLQIGSNQPGKEPGAWRAGTKINGNWSLQGYVRRHYLKG